MTEQIKLTVKYAYDIHKNNKYTTFDTRNICHCQCRHPRDTANASDVLYFSDISAFLFVEMRQMLCCVIMIDPRI